MPIFDLQGHRGARGLKPENTLPSFEVALDLGVSSIETDVHLTRDSVPVLVHDSQLSSRIHRPTAGMVIFPRLAISNLTIRELHEILADGNPSPERLSRQDASATPLAETYAIQTSLQPY